MLIDNIKRLSGVRMIVDSSKNLQKLNYLLQESEFKIHVVFLIKDVRSYLYSQKNRALKRKGGAVKRFFSKNSTFNLLVWYFGNRRFLNYFKKKNIQVIKIGYEELCLRPHDSLLKICGRLGLEYKQDMLSFSPERSVSHNLRGNSMRFDKRKSGDIQYDYRWMVDQGLDKMLFSYLVRKFNKKNVYSNNFTKNMTSG